MVAVLPDSIRRDGIYKAGQVCRMLGIGQTTLHRWRKAGYIKPVHRPLSKENLYTGASIINLHKFVY